MNLPTKYSSRNYVHVYCVYIWNLGEYKDGNLILNNPNILTHAKASKKSKKCKFCKGNIGLIILLVFIF